MSSTTPAGWYPDPEREGATRWWDGAQWAPSQEPESSDDRFKPKDDADAGASDAGATDAGGSAGDEPAWSPEPYAGPGTAWDGQGAADSSAQPSQSWSPSASAPAASTPSWQQQETPSWQQPATPAWGQQDAQPSYGAPQDFGQTGTQQWNQYDQQPKKSRTGLIVGLLAGGALLLGLLLVGGFFLVRGVLGAATPPAPTADGEQTGPGSFQVSVPADGQAVQEIEITTAGSYEISVQSLNGEDPRIELSGNGGSWSDDDGGDGLDSLLEVDLDAGTYTLVVEEFGGDPLQAQVTVTER